MSVRGFRELQVWQLGKELVVDVYAVTRAFPHDELYGLVSQMRRAAISIPSNIAEGFSRRHRTEYRQFLYVALGSCAELETQVELASDLAYVDPHQQARMLDKLDHEAKMLRNLIKRLDGPRPEAEQRPINQARK